MKARLIFLIALLGHWQPATAQGIGKWAWTAKGLPTYQYTGPLPAKAVDKEGKDAMLPDDPYFLLGNYRLTLFTHASGIYQFLTGERAWARINGVAQPNYGWNDASLRIDGTKTTLTGLHSVAADPSITHKTFGVGFARYHYQLPGNIACTRIISVKPSPKINTGNPAFVVTVILKNTGSKPQSVAYSERMLVNYVLNSTQFTDAQKRPLLYHSTVGVDAAKQLATAAISFNKNTLLVLPANEQRYSYDVSPPVVFMHANPLADKQMESVVSADYDTLATTINTSLKRGETRAFHLVIGLADRQNFAAVQKQVDDLLVGADLRNPTDGLFAQQWKARLPNLGSEKDDVLRREMLWNAHMVEASATYSDYYKETFIPQGTVYCYHFGDNISNRDHLQAALPACYTNPELAKSAIRYVIMHSEVDGEIKRGDAGFGYTPPSLYKESDEQLYFFNTLAEYLLITKDYGFLNEQVVYYPAEDRKTDALLNVVKKYFIYMRDEIGTGPDGLVKMLNSDWSDSFFHEYSPNRYSWSAESHLNSAMVLAIFPKLMDALQQSGNPDAAALITALETYRAGIEQVFMKDLGTRKFAARAYLNDDVRFGLDNVCIEPQGYVLQIPTLPKERKRAMYEYIKSKLLTPEKTGMRTREKPLWKGKPEGEDGGIWFSLEYPVLLGVATFDKAEAWALLKRFSFDNRARNYPNYWLGQWTAPDDLNSTLSTREGLYAFWEPDLRRAFQGYCSHPHTWPLFCYFKLREDSRIALRKGQQTHQP
jgi:cellobiose phosphorylase